MRREGGGREGEVLRSRLGGLSGRHTHAPRVPSSDPKPTPRKEPPPLVELVRVVVHSFLPSSP